MVLEWDVARSARVSSCMYVFAYECIFYQYCHFEIGKNTEKGTSFEHTHLCVTKKQFDANFEDTSPC
jgi:hypothetical protein